jgi:hypothetical protein
MHFQLQTDAEWEGVMRIAHHLPILLERAHGETRLACVVGDCVVWDGAAEEAQALEARFRNFARIAGLEYVQIAVARRPGTGKVSAEGFEVVAVEAQAQFPRFSQEAQSTIAEALADLLTGSQTRVRGRQPGDAPHPVSIGGGAR